MRIAAISDVHGNLHALDAVLEDLGLRAVDLVVNLGDHLSGALSPAATADRLMSFPAVSVRGNHDRQVLAGRPEEMSSSDRLAHDELRPRHRDWLAGLPGRVEVVPGVLAFHGVPDDDATYLTETVTPGGLRPAATVEVEHRLGGFSSYALFLCGHTHLQRSMRLAAGGLVLNPGSVGLPAYEDDVPYQHLVEAGTPHARYAVVDDSSGRWEPEFFAVEYPWDAAADVARANGRADVEHALRRGTVPRRTV